MIPSSMSVFTYIPLKNINYTKALFKRVHLSAKVEEQSQSKAHIKLEKISSQSFYL